MNDYTKFENTGAELEYKATTTINNQKWTNKIWLTQTLGQDYKIFIKTKVTNQETDTTRGKTNAYTIMKKRSILERAFGLPKYQEKNMPRIPRKIRKQVKKLRKNLDTMKKEEQLLNKNIKKLEKQMKTLNLEHELRKEGV